MHQKLPRAFTFAALLCLSAISHAEVSAETAESLMHKSGLWQQLAGVAPQARAGFMASASQSKKPPSPSEVERVLKVFDHAYAADRLRAASLAVLARNLDSESVPELERWYASPLGQKVSRMEEAAAAATGKSQEALVQQGAELLRKMPEARRAVLNDLVVTSRSAEVLAELTIETTLSAVQGMASAAPDAQLGALPDLRHVLNERRPQIEAAMGAAALTSFARMYSSLSTDEIRRYVNFMKSTDGKHFNAMGAKAFIEALKEGAAEFGRRLPGTKDESNT